MGILSGYRVVDLTIAMAGPLAAMRLGDLGADVIKVEPVTGEWQRHTPAGGAAGHQINASFLSLNRNKRSLAVNLKSPEGREIVLGLARRSEVFLQNYRPGWPSGWAWITSPSAPPARTSCTCRSPGTARAART